MADKISFADTTGLTFYRIIRNSAGLFVNGTTPEAYNPSNRTTYAVSVPETPASSGQYSVSFPALATGLYLVDVFLQAGGSPAVSDGVRWSGEYDWSGTAFRHLDAVPVDLTQSLTDVKTATVAGALHAAWTWAFGKIVEDEDALTLKLYGYNSQSVPLITHDLDSAANPSTRTPQ